MGIQSIEQKRAAFALEKVESLNQNLDKNSKERGEWRSRAIEIPAMIQMNGLGQTLAFYKSKGKGAHSAAFDLLEEWLCQKRKIFNTKNNNADLLKSLTQGDIAQYRAAQAEALALLVWVKKFTRAYFKED